MSENMQPEQPTSDQATPIIFPTNNTNMSQEPNSLIDPNPLLPPPSLPKLEPPEPPLIPGVDPLTAKHPSCEGELYEQHPSPDTITPPVPGMPRILIGIPMLLYSHDFVQHFLKFWTQCSTMPVKRFEIGYHFAYRRPAHMADQDIVDVALYNKCTHVLFIDDDIWGYSVEDLLKLLDADKDIISGVMYASKFPYAMCCFRRFDTAKKVIDMPSDNRMYRLYEIPCLCTNCSQPLSHWDAKFCPVCGTPQDNLIQPVDLIPFPFTLMKTSVFGRLKKPYFHCTNEYPCDSWFADRCIEAGIQEYAHMGVRLTHAGVNDITRPHMFQMEVEKKKHSPNPGIINITPEEMHRHEFLLQQKMKSAEERVKYGEAKGFVVPRAPQPQQPNEQPTPQIAEAVLVPAPAGGIK